MINARRDAIGDSRPRDRANHRAAAGHITGRLVQNQAMNPAGRSGYDQGMARPASPPIGYGKEPTSMATVTTPLRIGPADRGRTMTLDEFFEAEAEEGPRYELARGVLQVEDIPDDAHGLVVCHLYQALANHRGKSSSPVLRFGGGAEFRFWLPGFVSSRSPDLGVVLRGAPRDWTGSRIAVLAGEVVSRGSVDRDYVTKREEYLAYGLMEYWIVDPLERKVTVLTRHGDTWAEVVFRGDQIIASLVLPGFATTVAELWVDVDEDEDAAEAGVNGG
jgi:Uma2 family endonuclease